MIGKPRLPRSTCETIFLSLADTKINVLNSIFLSFVSMIVRFTSVILAYVSLFSQQFLTNPFYLLNLLTKPASWLNLYSRLFITWFFITWFFIICDKCASIDACSSMTLPTCQRTLQPVFMATAAGAAAVSTAITPYDF